MEDLQFQLLELGVISGDQLEQTAESSQERLASLAAQLEREKQRVRDLEAQLQVSGACSIISQIPDLHKHRPHPLVLVHVQNTLVC